MIHIICYLLQIKLKYEQTQDNQDSQSIECYDSKAKSINNTQIDSILNYLLNLNSNKIPKINLKSYKLLGKIKLEIFFIYNKQRNSVLKIYEL